MSEPTLNTGARPFTSPELVQLRRPGSNVDERDLAINTERRDSTTLSEATDGRPANTQIPDTLDDLGTRINTTLGGDNLLSTDQQSDLFQVATQQQFAALRQQSDALTPDAFSWARGDLGDITTYGTGSGGSGGGSGGGGGGSRTASGKYADLFNRYGAKYGISPVLLSAIAKAESGYNPNARSPVGAQGLMQFMPGTAREYGVRNPLNPAQAVEGAAKFLSSLLRRFNGNLNYAIAAYNAGPGAVSKYNGIPPYRETQNYVRKVNQYMAAMGGSGSGGSGGSGGGGGGSSTRGRVLALAKSYIGTPYVWGGAKPGGFDCSGLLYYAMNRYGMRVPRIAAQQATIGKRTSISNLSPGDFVVKNDGSHIAFYLGNGKILEAPRTGLKVRIRSLGRREGYYGVHVRYPGER